MSAVGDGLRNALGSFLGYAWCHRCRRSYWYTDPGHGVPVDYVSGRVLPRESPTGSYRFALCAGCEAILTWDEIVAWDTIRLGERRRRYPEAAG